VNCYFLAAGDGYILIDTGFAAKRVQLENSLESVGCKPGKLKLIVLTHGDSDHAGNCAFLRNKYGCKIAMHSSDSGMVERGDMSWNRKAKPDKFSLLFRLMGLVAKVFSKGVEFEKFKPDIMIDEGFDLSPYGLHAKILHIPGHSKGSIGILTEDGELFCGDFAYNIPGFRFIDDMADYTKSVEKLKQLRIETIYPGHGKPFPMSVLVKRA
jgi:glyoxylase-like metal-dependent hydrolase (beta-lactamase superfamily II)